MLNNKYNNLNWLNFQRRGGDIDSSRTGTIAERGTKTCVQENLKSVNNYHRKGKIGGLLRTSAGAGQLSGDAEKYTGYS